MAPQLFLIDGNSLVYRAFFALPDTIATSKGEPTNAIFGFASMLVKLLTEYGTVPTLVVWDAGWSGRETIYTEYKAERRSRPDQPASQTTSVGTVPYSVSSFTSIEAKPKMAFVGSPFEVAIVSGSAKKAR